MSVGWAAAIWGRAGAGRSCGREPTTTRAVGAGARGSLPRVKYVRFRAAAAGLGPTYGRLDGDLVHALDASPLTGGRETGAVHRLADVALLVPCEPTKILGVGLNYRS